MLDKSLTAKQRDLVRSSFCRIVFEIDMTVDRFYKRLLEQLPDAWPLLDEEEEFRRKRLLRGFARVVAAMEGAAHAAAGLGATVIDLGLDVMHRSKVAAAFLKTVEDVLGASFTPDIENAWRSALGYPEMQRAAA